MPYIGRSRPVFNFNRPSNFDSLGRADMRRRAEHLERQIEGGDFEAFMHERHMDEATIQREMNKAREILAYRRTAAENDSS